jgi:hypothetical protein
MAVVGLFDWLTEELEGGRLDVQSAVPSKPVPMPEPVPEGPRHRRGEDTQAWLTGQLPVMRRNRGPQ